MLAVLAGFIWWRIGRSGQREVVRRVGRLRLTDKLRLGARLFADRRVPLAVRLLVIGVVFYLALPIDLIPDFIPVLGYADDVLVLAVGVGLLLWSVPAGVLEEHVARLEGERGSRPYRAQAGEEMRWNR